MGACLSCLDVASQQFQDAFIQDGKWFGTTKAAPAHGVARVAEVVIPPTNDWPKPKLADPAPTATSGATAASNWSIIVATTRDANSNDRSDQSATHIECAASAPAQTPMHVSSTPVNSTPAGSAPIEPVEPRTTNPQSAPKAQLMERRLQPAAPVAHTVLVAFCTARVKPPEPGNRAIRPQPRLPLLPNPLLLQPLAPRLPLVHTTAYLLARATGLSPRPLRLPVITAKALPGPRAAPLALPTAPAEEVCELQPLADDDATIHIDVTTPPINHNTITEQILVHQVPVDPTANNPAAATQAPAPATVAALVAAIPLSLTMAAVQNHLPAAAHMPLELYLQLLTQSPRQCGEPAVAAVAYLRACPAVNSLQGASLPLLTALMYAAQDAPDTVVAEAALCFYADSSEGVAVQAGVATLMLCALHDDVLVHVQHCRLPPSVVCGAMSEASVVLGAGSWGEVAVCLNPLLLLAAAWPQQLQENTSVLVALASAKRQQLYSGLLATGAAVGQSALALHNLMVLAQQQAGLGLCTQCLTQVLLAGGYCPALLLDAAACSGIVLPIVLAIENHNARQLQQQQPLLMWRSMPALLLAVHDCVVLLHDRVLLVRLMQHVVPVAESHGLELRAVHALLLLAVSHPAVIDDEPMLHALCQWVLPSAVEAAQPRGVAAMCVDVLHAVPAAGGVRLVVPVVVAGLMRASFQVGSRLLQDAQRWGRAMRLAEEVFSTRGLEPELIACLVVASVDVPQVHSDLLVLDYLVDQVLATFPQLAASPVVLTMIAGLAAAGRKVALPVVRVMLALLGGEGCTAMAQVHQAAAAMACSVARDAMVSGRALERVVVVGGEGGVAVVQQGQGEVKAWFEVACSTGRCSGQGVGVSTRVSLVVVGSSNGVQVSHPLLDLVQQVDVV